MRGTAHQHSGMFSYISAEQRVSNKIATHDSALGGRGSAPTTAALRLHLRQKRWLTPGRPGSACGSMRGDLWAVADALGGPSGGLSARSGCVSETHDIVRRAIRIADEAPLRARFTSPC